MASPVASATPEDTDLFALGQLYLGATTDVDTADILDYYRRNSGYRRERSRPSK